MVLGGRMYVYLVYIFFRVNFVDLGDVCSKFVVGMLSLVVDFFVFWLMRLVNFRGKGGKGLELGLILWYEEEEEEEEEWEEMYKFFF